MTPILLLFGHCLGSSEVFHYLLIVFRVIPTIRYTEKQALKLIRCTRKDTCYTFALTKAGVISCRYICLLVIKLRTYIERPAGASGH